MTPPPGRAVRPTDEYRQHVETYFAAARDGRPSPFEFMDVDHCEIRHRLAFEWVTIPTILDDQPGVRELYQMSGTGQPFIWTALGRELPDSSIELFSLTIEWLDGREPPPDLDAG